MDNNQGPSSSNPSQSQDSPNNTPSARKDLGNKELNDAVKKVYRKVSPLKRTEFLENLPNDGIIPTPLEVMLAKTDLTTSNLLVIASKYNIPLGQVKRHVRQLKKRDLTVEEENKSDVPVVNPLPCSEASSSSNPEDSQAISLVSISFKGLATLRRLELDLNQVKVCSEEVFRNALYSTEWEDMAIQLHILATSDILISNQILFKAAEILRTKILPFWNPCSSMQDEMMLEWMELFLTKHEPPSIIEREKFRAFVDKIILPWAPIFIYGKVILFTAGGVSIGLLEAVEDACMVSRFQFQGLDYIKDVASLLEF